MNETSWLAKARPMSGAVRVIGGMCVRCGRAVYMTSQRKDWGLFFCAGCDEERSECWCPDVRETA